MLKAFVDGRFFGASYGEDPWVLALHGWGRTHHDFDRVLGDGIGGVALDLPGFGATPPPPEVWGSPDYAEALVPVLEQMGPASVLLGHSFGGRVAIYLALKRPDLTRALVLTGVPQLVRHGGRSSPPVGFRFGRRLHKMGVLGDSAMERLRMRYGSSDYRAARGVMRGVCVRVLGEDYEEELQALDRPVELVWGEADTAAGVGMAEEATKLAETARLTVLRGVGHLVPTEAPEALRSVLASYKP